MRIALTLALTLVASLALAQGDEDDQREACMGDAFKFCGNYIPDHQRIAACLEAKRTQITPQCRSLLDNDGHSTRRRKRS